MNANTANSPVILTQKYLSVLYLFAQYEAKRADNLV